MKDAEMEFKINMRMLFPSPATKRFAMELDGESHFIKGAQEKDEAWQNGSSSSGFDSCALQTMMYERIYTVCWILLKKRFGCRPLRPDE